MKAYGIPEYHNSVGVIIDASMVEVYSAGMNVPEYRMTLITGESAGTKIYSLEYDLELVSDSVIDTNLLDWIESARV